MQHLRRRGRIPEQPRHLVHRYKQTPAIRGRWWWWTNDMMQAALLGVMVADLRLP